MSAPAITSPVRRAIVLVACLVAAFAFGVSGAKLERGGSYPKPEVCRAGV